jgi:pimeloyl-ACP methyl ester carboxylesterase
MYYPIVEVKTKDKLALYGLLSEPTGSKTIYLNIHGTGSSFFCEAFQQIFYDELPKLGIDVLFTNNRGSYTLDSWQDTGAALEIFEDSVLDIDAWIKWAMGHNYTKIILSGHSHGTEKVVYYMNHGQYKDKVSAVVLMGFCDSVGTQKNFEKTISVDLMSEAREKVSANRGYELLTGHRRAQAGELPIGAKTYLNYFSENSELSKTTSFRSNTKLPMIGTIKVPILATIGDHEEYTIIPIKDAISLLEKENSLVEAHQIIGSGHCYEGYQHVLIEIVKKFLYRNKFFI